MILRQEGNLLRFGERVVNSCLGLWEASLLGNVMQLPAVGHWSLKSNI